MEDISSIDYYEDQTIVYSGGSNMLLAGLFGAILMIASRIPSLLFNFELMSNVVPSPTATWALLLSLGSLVALVAGILMGLGLMALMKRYGKPYGPILFLAVVVPSLISQFFMLQVTSPEQAIVSGMLLSVIGIVASVIISGGILMIRTQSVKPNLSLITGILYLSNPISFMLSGALLMITQNPSIAYPIYFLTTIGFAFIVNTLFILLFYTEANTCVTQTLAYSG
ncbi:MAG: hypothetical protein PVG65_06325 [Candidatus Thorarchaeota archaeon]|jgi:hypothetical protein